MRRSRPTSTCFGQVVVGPPGSGKTTYVRGMREALALLGRRVVVVNLDPGNEEAWSADELARDAVGVAASPREALDAAAKTALVDLAELVSTEEAQRALHLGPNGAAVFCMEFLLARLSWLVDRLRACAEEDEERPPYFLFDMPGQVELFTHHDAVSRVVSALTRELDVRLVAVHLVDATHALDPSTFISVAVLALLAMFRLALPHVNVLSKMDLLDEDELAFPLDFYTDLTSIADLAPLVGQSAAEASTARGRVFAERRRRLYDALCELIDEYGQVGFRTLNVRDAASMADLIRVVDRAGGFYQAPPVPDRAREQQHRHGHREAR